MKHIKPYKIFESTESFPDKVKEDIEDIFRDLELDEYDVSFKGLFNFHSDYKKPAKIGFNTHISCLKDGVVRLSDIKDVISRLLRYFKTIDGVYKLQIAPTHDEYYTLSEYKQEYGSSEEFSEFNIMIYKD